MAWIDDLSSRISSVVPEGVTADINAYLKARIVDPVVKIGQPQTGNLTAEQLAAGVRGGQVPTAAASSPASATQNAAQASMLTSFGLGSVPPMILLLGVGAIAYVMLKKRRG